VEEQRIKKKFTTEPQRAQRKHREDLKLTYKLNPKEAKS
jgi:hypothetical protein